MEIGFDNLPNDILYIIVNQLNFNDKQSFRLLNKDSSEVISKFHILKPILEEFIYNTYIKFDKTYIPFGLLINWALFYPIVTHESLKSINKVPSYWLAIKSATIYNKNTKDIIIHWANNYREKYIKNIFKI